MVFVLLCLTLLSMRISRPIHVAVVNNFLVVLFVSFFLSLFFFFDAIRNSGILNMGNFDCVRCQLDIP